MYKRQVPHDAYWVYAVAAAIAAMGFATIFNVQRRLLWVVAVGGIIAVCTRIFVDFELGYGPFSYTHLLAAMDPLNPKYDRLKLTAERIRAIAGGILQVPTLP